MDLMYGFLCAINMMSPGMMRSVLAADASQPATITNFLSFASELLTWVLTSMTSIIGWLFANPAALLFLVLALIIAVWGMVRHSLS